MRRIVGRPSVARARTMKRSGAEPRKPNGKHVISVSVRPLVGVEHVDVAGGTTAVDSTRYSEITISRPQRDRVPTASPSTAGRTCRDGRPATTFPTSPGARCRRGARPRVGESRANRPGPRWRSARAAGSESRQSSPSASSRPAMPSARLRSNRALLDRLIDLQRQRRRRSSQRQHTSRQKTPANRRARRGVRIMACRFPRTRENRPVANRSPDGPGRR